MKFYSIAELDITDPSWVGPYVQTVTPMIERYGGRYLARTSNIQRLEGTRDRPQIYVIVEWPSRETALAFYESEEYRPFREQRQAGASNYFLVFPGEDVTGAAKIT